MKRKLNRLCLTVFFALGIFYFSYHIVSGDNGVLAMIRLDNKVETAKIRLNKIKSEKVEIKHRTSMLYPDSIDIDLLDEESRRQLGYARKDEVVYFIPEEER